MRRPVAASRSAEVGGPRLERQHREHRAWYALLDAPNTLRELEHAAARRASLNALWPRPTLDGCTAEQAWQQHRRGDIDRWELLRDVDRRTATLRSDVETLRARRSAVEAALTDFSYALLLLRWSAAAPHASS